MKRILAFFLLLAVLVSSCASKPCTFTQEELCLERDGKTIYGILFRPDGIKRAPLVIVSHGFGGTHQFGKAYAEALAPLGYAVYCHDFCGGSNWSRSDGKTTEMSIFSEAEDLKAVMDQLSEKDFIDPKHITLIGESQGGMVSSLVTAERKEQVEKLILIYPALCIKDDWITMYPTLEDMPDTVDFWGIKLSHAYLEGLYDLDVYGTIGQYEGPVQIYHGDEDKVVNISYSEKAQETYKNATLTVFPGEGHGFTPETQAKVIESIIQKDEKKNI